MTTKLMSMEEYIKRKREMNLNLGLPLPSDDPTTYRVKYRELVKRYLTLYSAALSDGIFALDPKDMKEFIDQYGYSHWWMTRRGG